MIVLALALPIQGAAATTMLHCGPTQHGPAHAQHTVGASAPGSTNVPAAAPHHVAALGGAHSADDTEVDVMADLVKAKCSVCAACCMAAVLPTSVFVVGHFSTAGFVAPLLPFVAPVFLTAGPDRPPRLHLA